MIFLPSPATPFFPWPAVVSHLCRGEPGPGGPMHAGQLIALGNLWPQRDLIFVTDTAKALTAMASGHGFDVFNVGTGTGTTIGDVLEEKDALPLMRSSTSQAVVLIA